MAVVASLVSPPVPLSCPLPLTRVTPVFAALGRCHSPGCPQQPGDSSLGAFLGGPSEHSNRENKCLLFFYLFVLIWGFFWSWQFKETLLNQGVGEELCSE